VGSTATSISSGDVSTLSQRFPLRGRACALNTDRELWSSDGDYYSDRVFVTEGGGIGMHAAFGRVIVKSVGEWHYLSKEVDRLKAGYASFPRDVACVLSLMGDGEGVLSAATISSETGIPEKRVKEVHRALKVLGLTQFGVLCDADADGYIARGSGYWLTRTGDDLAAGLHAASVDRSPEGGNHEDGCHAKHESAVPERQTPNPSRQDTSPSSKDETI
jgi:hypothetical protein